MTEQFEPNIENKKEISKTRMEKLIDLCDEKNADEVIIELQNILKKYKFLVEIARVRLEKAIVDNDEARGKLENKNILGEEKIISDQMHEFLVKSRALRKILESLPNK